MTYEEAAKLVLLAIGDLPNLQDKKTQPMIATYQLMLADMPYKLAEAALVKVKTTKTISTLPTVGEIREAALGIVATDTPSAEEAWGEVQKYISSSHNYLTYTYAGAKPEWSNPAIETTVNQIGLREMFEIETDHISIIRAQFLKMYAANLDNQKEKIVNEQVQQLTGQLVKKLEIGGVNP